MVGGMKGGTGGMSASPCAPRAGEGEGRRRAGASAVAGSPSRSVVLSEPPRSCCLTSVCVACAGDVGVRVGEIVWLSMLTACR